jgi:2,3-bisphosphoglycerate-dependent phosphoglycerate mutase
VLSFLLERWGYEDAGSWPAPSNCGVTTYRCAGSRDRLELEEYNRLYWTVGSPED